MRRVFRLQEVRQKFFQKKVFLFDLDGTLYLGGRVIEGAVELIQKLRQENKRIFFFTNNSSRSEQQYHEKLNRMGFGPRPDEIIMSTHILIRYLRDKKISRIFLLGTPAMETMLKEVGFETTTEAQAVVVGFDKTLSYEKLQTATRLIERGVPYIVTHPDLYCPTDEGREPDCGAIAKLLEAVTERQAKIVLGKPHPMMMKEAIVRCRAPKKEMILTGDRLSTDIQMAKTFGIESLLVLSGETTKGRLKSSKLKPTFVLGSVQDLL